MQAREKLRPAIAFLDFLHNGDDTVVATQFALNPEVYNIQAFISNDETDTKVRVRAMRDFLGSVNSPIPFAMGFPSDKKRPKEKQHIEDFTDSNMHGIDTNGVGTTIEIINRFKGNVDLYILGGASEAWYAVAHVLEERPEYRNKIHIKQMGPKFDGAFPTKTNQYNYGLGLKDGSTEGLLQEVEQHDLLMSHTTWGIMPGGIPNINMELSIYKAIGRFESPVHIALRESDNPLHNYMARQHDFWKYPSSVMHDNMVLLANRYPGLVDFWPANIVYDRRTGKVDLTTEDLWRLRSQNLHLPYLANYESVNIKQEPLFDDDLEQRYITKRANISLGMDYDRARLLLLQELQLPNPHQLNEDWKTFNAALTPADIAEYKQLIRQKLG